MAAFGPSEVQSQEVVKYLRAHVDQNRKGDSRSKSGAKLQTPADIACVPDSQVEGSTQEYAESRPKLPSHDKSAEGCQLVTSM